MKLVLLGSAGAAVLYALARVVWHADNATLDIGLAWLTAAVCTGSAAIVDAVDRSRPKVISQDNGGPRKE